jgi:hypothetical protein
MGRIVNPLGQIATILYDVENRRSVESRCGAVVLGSAYLFPALSVAGASLAPNQANPFGFGGTISQKNSKSCGVFRGIRVRTTPC